MIAFVLLLIIFLALSGRRLMARVPSASATDGLVRIDYGLLDERPRRARHVRRLLTDVIHDIAAESLRLLTVGRVTHALAARFLLRGHCDLNIYSVFRCKVFGLAGRAKALSHHHGSMVQIFVHCAS